MADETQAVQGEAAGPVKNKKVNKLSLDELSRKIDALEKGNQIKSKYYQHLVLRKKELQP